MAAYKLASQGVQRTADGALIPSSAANADWLEYQKWLAAGNTPDPEFTAEELAAQAAQAAETAAVNVLSTEAHADAIFTQLKTATGAEISAFVAVQFPLFTAQQQAIMKLPLQVAVLTLRRGAV